MINGPMHRWRVEPSRRQGIDFHFRDPVVDSDPRRPHVIGFPGRRHAFDDHVARPDEHRIGCGVNVAQTQRGNASASATAGVAPKVRQDLPQRAVGKYVAKIWPMTRFCVKTERIWPTRAGPPRAPPGQTCSYWLSTLHKLFSSIEPAMLANCPASMPERPLSMSAGEPAPLSSVSKIPLELPVWMPVSTA